MNYTSDMTNSLTARLRQPELFMTMVGFTALTVGMLIYLFDRSATAVYFIPDSWKLAKTTPLLFGTLGNYLPAFLHTLAFALFANAIAGRRYIGLMCLSWFAAEVFFELAQIDAIAFRISGFLPVWFAEWPILENISSHFVTGQFDRLDIFFLMLGCITAYLIGYMTLPQLNKGIQPQRASTSRTTRLAGLMLVAFVGCTSIISSGGTGKATIASVHKTESFSQKVVGPCSSASCQPVMPSWSVRQPTGADAGLTR